MTLQEYMQLRFSNRKVKALGKLEAKIFGIDLKKGWFKRNADLEISDSMLEIVFNANNN